MPQNSGGCGWDANAGTPSKRHTIPGVHGLHLLGRHLGSRLRLPALLLCQICLTAVIWVPAPSLAAESKQTPSPRGPLVPQVLCSYVPPAEAPPTSTTPTSTPETSPSPALLVSLEPTVPPPLPTATHSAPAAAPEAAPYDCAGIIALVNDVRSQYGLAALAANGALTTEAQRYAELIASMGALSHTADGLSIEGRAAASGYSNWTALGENLAAGYSTGQEAVTAWLASPGHRTNVLNASFTETGVGCAWDVSSDRYFLVQEFGAR